MKSGNRFRSLFRHNTATLWNTLHLILLPFIRIKTTSWNSIQFFSDVLGSLALISFSLSFPYLFLPIFLFLNFLWHNAYDLRHLFCTFRVKETTVSEIERLSQYSSIFPIPFQTKRVDDLLIRRKRQNLLYSIHEFQFHPSEKFILSFASSILLLSISYIFNTFTFTSRCDSVT